MNDYQQKLSEVLRESAVKEVEGENLLYLSSGVVLEIIDVSPMLALDVSNKFKLPSVPIIYDSEKEIGIPNPMDDEYLRQCEIVKMDQGNAILDVLIAKGTKLHSAPDGFATPESDAWLDDVEFLLKYEIDRRPLARYLAWVRYIACVSQEDFTRLTEKAYAKLGVTQEAVGAGFLP